jgi:hypothetical protein
MQLFVLGRGAAFAYQVWLMLNSESGEKRGWIAALFHETLDLEASPIQFWALVACESGLAAAFLVCGFLPTPQMRSLLASMLG